MKAKFIIELEAEKNEINDFVKNINHFVHRRRSIVIDVEPLGGYIPQFYLPQRKPIRIKNDYDKIKV